MSNYFPGKYLYGSITQVCKLLPLRKLPRYCGASLVLHQEKGHCMVLNSSLNSLSWLPVIQGSLLPHLFPHSIFSIEQPDWSFNMFDHINLLFKTLIMTFPLALNKIPNSHSSIQGFLWSVLCYFPKIITYCCVTYSIRDTSICLLSLEHATHNLPQDLCTHTSGMLDYQMAPFFTSIRSQLNWKVRASLTTIFKITCFSVPSLPSFVLLFIYSKRIAIWQIIWL